MENPTFYKNMEEYRKECVDPLKERVIINFQHNYTKYGIVITYDDCLNRTVQVAEYMDTPQMNTNDKRDYRPFFHIFLTSGYVMILDASGELFNKCLDVLDTDYGNGSTVLETIYDIYIDCLSYDSDKMDAKHRHALKNSYIVDKEVYKKSLLERKESKFVQDSSPSIDLSATEMFNITHPDKYFFIESVDVRNYLNSINHEFSRAERLYLIFNSTNLGYVETMDALAYELDKDGYEEEIPEWLKEQVIGRINYMESVIKMFNTSEEGVIYSIEIIGSKIIAGPLFTDSKSAHHYCLENNPNKYNFRIAKKRINNSHKISNNGTCGIAEYNHEGILLDCNVPGFYITCGKDENRFEKDITVNIPHPFISGDIVTDGKTVYYVKSPIDITHMWNTINHRNKDDNKYDGENNDFNIDCYCLSNENSTDCGNIVILNRDVRKLTYVPEAKDQLARITTILRMFDKKKSNDYDGGFKVD